MSSLSHSETPTLTDQVQENTASFSAIKTPSLSLSSSQNVPLSYLNEVPARTQQSLTQVNTSIIRENNHISQPQSQAPIQGQIETSKIEEKSQLQSRQTTVSGKVDADSHPNLHSLEYEADSRQNHLLSETSCVAVNEPLWQRGWKSAYYNESHRILRREAARVANLLITPNVERWTKQGFVDPETRRKIGNTGAFALAVGACIPICEQYLPSS